MVASFYRDVFQPGKLVRVDGRMDRRSQTQGNPRRKLDLVCKRFHIGAEVLFPTASDPKLTTKAALYGQKVYYHTHVYLLEQIWKHRIFVCCSLSISLSVYLKSPNLFQHDKALFTN